MPYKSLKDANPAIKGIKPPVSLEQANSISAQADAIEKGENPPESPWAVAISSFKKGHEVVGGKWVKKEGEMDEAGAFGPENCVCPDCGMKQKKEVGVPCRSVECPECSVKMVAGVEGEEEKAEEFAPAWKLAVGGEDVPVQELVDAWKIIKERKKEIKPKSRTFSVGDMGRFGELFEDFMDKFLGLVEESAAEETGEIEEMGFSESGLDVLELVDGLEEGELEEGGQPTHLRMKVRLVKQGWGNKRDNNYYPKNTLLRDSGVWVGSKMYETDHRPSEKSNRTWVSTVEKIVEHLPDGSPVGLVGVHSPGFAERARNLDKLGLLDKLSCSITGNGRSKSGFKLGDRRGKYVEAITEGGDVDWVTSPGAGGMALSLAESELGGEDQEKLGTVAGAGGQALALTEGEPGLTGTSEGEGIMSKELEVEKKETSEAAPVEVIIEAEEVRDEKEKELEETKLQETEAVEGEAAPEDAKEMEEKTEVEAEEPKPVVESTVKAELLKDSNLPSAAQVRLAMAEYETEGDLEQAIKEEAAYLQEITGAGKPFGMGEGATSGKSELSEVERLAQVEERKNAVNAKFGLTMN